MREAWEEQERLQRFVLEIGSAVADQVPASILPERPVDAHAERDDRARASRRSGRPRDKDHEWARQQVYRERRDPQQVKQEWLKRVAERNLVNPDATWRALIKLKPEK